MHCSRLFGKDLPGVCQLVRGKEVYQGKKVKSIGEPDRL